VDRTSSRYADLLLVEPVRLVEEKVVIFLERPPACQDDPLLSAPSSSGIRAFAALILSLLWSIGPRIL
jgi:hypothetical protein